MDEGTLFSETQKFTKWWLWLILLTINGLFVFGIYHQVITGEQFGTKPLSDTALVVTTGCTMLVTVLIFCLRLDTQIKNDGIYVKFFPFHLSFRKYTWEIISKSFVTQYHPVKEYGGWGFRVGIFGNGKAFNVSGNKGLQIVFSNNKKLLIGTNKPEELSIALTRIGKLSGWDH